MAEALYRTISKTLKAFDKGIIEAEDDLDDLDELFRDNDIVDLLSDEENEIVDLLSEDENEIIDLLSDDDKIIDLLSDDDDENDS
jgi:DNA (cytosine-5)-methyltransferase 1